MSKREYSEERKRYMEAVGRKVAAQRKIRDCLQDRSPGHELVVRLMDAIYEKQIATSELFKASQANIAVTMKRFKPRDLPPFTNT